MEKEPPDPDQSLQEKLEESKSELENQEQLFSKYKIDLHKGYVLSSCHTCKTYIQIIKLKQDYIGMIWKKTSGN